MTTQIKKVKINWLVEILLLLIGSIVFTVISLLALPASFGWGKLWTIFFSALIPAVVGIIISWVKTENDYSNPCIHIDGSLQAIITIVVGIVMIVLGIGGGVIFHADEYASSLTINEVSLTEKALPSIDDVEQISLMDTDSARKLGDRTLGELSEYISQYNVSDAYTTIVYQGKVYKIAPLEHASFFKACNNDTIPGYVMVNAVTSEAKFIKVEEGIKYSPSAYFSKDLTRHVRKNYKGLLDTAITEGDEPYYNFQIDEEGVPYFVLTTYEYKVWMSAKIPTGAVIVNAITGETQVYNLSELPTWVDQVVNGDDVIELYNRHGQYINGAFNFSDTGKTQTTDDYGYIERDGDICIYTGVTSVAADESNIGFIMVNSRTGVCDYYPIAGAEEYSAMSSAEGLLQQFGYTASFPSLVMYGDYPTYVMTLKDDNGLVRGYAMCNMKHYTIVNAGDTLDECKQNYIRNMNIFLGKEEVNPTTSETITVSEIRFLTIENDTVVYIKDENNRCFKEKFSFNENLIFLEVGQTVEVEYETLSDITSAKIILK